MCVLCMSTLARVAMSWVDLMISRSIGRRPIAWVLPCHRECVLGSIYHGRPLAGLCSGSLMLRSRESLPPPNLIVPLSGRPI